MGGEAESYQNVEIEFIDGMHKTMLTIYHDNVPVEQIELSSLSTMEEMHQVFVEKGFVLKSPTEVAKLQKEKGAALDSQYKRAEDEYRQHLLKVERLMKQEEAEAAAAAAAHEKEPPQTSQRIETASPIEKGRSAVSKTPSRWIVMVLVVILFVVAAIFCKNGRSNWNQFPPWSKRENKLQ